MSNFKEKVRSYGVWVVVFTFIFGILFFINFCNPRRFIYDQDVTKDYELYNASKNIKTKDMLIDTLKRIGFEYQVEENKISTKYLNYDVDNDGKVNIQKNELTRFFDIYKTGTVDDPSYKLTDKKNNIFINIYDNDKEVAGISIDKSSEEILYTPDYQNSNKFYIFQIVLFGILFLILAVIAFCWVI